MVGFGGVVFVHLLKEGAVSLPIFLDGMSFLP